MDPLSSLLHRFNSSSFVSWPSSGGIEPLNSLSERWTFLRTINWPSSVGIEPLNSFTSSRNSFSSVSWPSSEVSQLFQFCELAQFRRYRTRQIVLREIQCYHSAGIVRGNTVPVFKRCIGQPAVADVPVIAICSFIKRDQSILICEWRRAERGSKRAGTLHASCPGKN